MSEFINQAKTLTLVGLITALVWLLAEAESLRTEKLRTEVVFRTKPESGRFVRLDGGQEFTGPAVVSIEGPTADVDAVSTRARRTIELEPGMEGVPAEPGRQTVNLAQALRSHPLFRDSHVTVTAVEPPSATVWVDTVVQRQVPVKVEVPEGTLLDGPPVADPATITVRLPESTSKREVEFQAVARLTPESLANLREGRRAVVTVPLTLPPSVLGEVLRMSPAQVGVTLTLRSRLASVVIPVVPVHVRLSPSDVGVWEVEVPPESRSLPNVTVSGPVELIDQVRAERVRVVATVPLTSDDLERAAAAGQPIEKEVVFSEVPTLLRFECQQKTVKLTIRRRS
jgi:hypothetical protein